MIRGVPNWGVYSGFHGDGGFLVMPGNGGAASDGGDCGSRERRGRIAREEGGDCGGAASDGWWCGG